MGKIKYTYEDVLKSFNERGYILVTTKDEYKNSSQKLQYICNKHKEFGVQKMRKTNMKRDIKGCKYCKGDLPEWYVIQKNCRFISTYRNYW